MNKIKKNKYSQNNSQKKILENLIRSKWTTSEKNEDFISYKINLENFQKFNIRKISLINNCNDIKILDFGCGEGGYVVAERINGRKAFGVDIKPENIRISDVRRKCNKIEVNIFSMIDKYGKTKFRDDYFDVITLFQVLEHVPPSELNNVFDEVRRILSPNGIVYFEIPNKYWPQEGHVTMHFVHWVPEKIRNFFYPIIFKSSSIMMKNNYLRSINYLSTPGWEKLISNKYPKISTPKKIIELLAYGPQYKFGSLKIIKNILRFLILLLPKFFVISFYKYFGPLSVFVVKK